MCYARQVRLLGGVRLVGPQSLATYPLSGHAYQMIGYAVVSIYQFLDLDLVVRQNQSEPRYI